MNWTLPLHQRLTQLRLKKGYSINKLATITGLSGSYLHSLESGRPHEPPWDKLAKLANALDVDVADLMEGVIMTLANHTGRTIRRKQ